MSTSHLDRKSFSFMGALCLGEIEEHVLVPYPKLKDAERETLRSVVSAIGDLLGPKEKDFRSWDRAGELPAEVLEELRAFGLFSLIIPESHGGMGLGSAAYSRALQEIARYDGSIAVTVGAHSSIGMRGLYLVGTQEQKDRWFSKLATGEMIAAFCLTEPGSGSDAASIRTTAVRDGDDYVLNGDKLWITNGGIASFFTVFAKDGAAAGKAQLTAFVVTRDMPGVSTGPHEDKLGLRASSTTTVHLDNVRVPASHVLGEVGKGFKVAMNILNSGRSGLGGGTVGVMKKLIALSTAQAKGRVQFGVPISSFGLVKQKVGHMVVDCYATESVVNLVAGLVDDGWENMAVESAISKIFGTEALWRCADEALQIAGGNGYMCEFPYERVLRDARINRIFEGTNEILRLFVALTAANAVGAELKDISASVKGIFDDPIKGFGVLTKGAGRRAALMAGLGRKGKFTLLESLLWEETTVFEKGVEQLALAADRILRKHGRNIIGKQFATNRLANIMIDLFVLSAVLARVDASVKSSGEEKTKKEREILRIFAGGVKRRVAANVAQIDDNEDELVKAVADHAFENEQFMWDNLNE